MVLDDGTRWNPEDFQLWLIEDLFAGAGEVWGVVPEGNGKALDISTPLATPSGWTTMLAVRPGDELLDSAGRPTRVTGVSDVMLGRPCYEVRFSDGASLVADADHRWYVEGAHDKYHGRVANTAELKRLGVEMSSGARRWRVPTAARRGEETQLPIDPYVLGVWLGDGAAGCGRVSVPDDHIWDRIKAAGFELGSRPPSASCRTQTLLGLYPRLRKIGLLGNKHIPTDYLMASCDQRLALIQGLLDTDGTVSKAGQVTFSTTSPALRDGFRALAWSLGRPCYVDENRAVLDGRDLGLAWELTVACDASHQLLSLPRKAVRLKDVGKTAEHRRIVAIEPVESRPVKCVEVAADDHLYLAGDALIPTHNTTLLGGVGLYACQYTRDADVVVGASSRDQAQILHDQAAGFVRRTEGLGKRFRVYDGYRKITSYVSGGRIRVFAADDRTGDGVIPTLALLDELHRHRDLRLYRTWRGKLDKRNGQLAAISTAGEPDSEFEMIRQRLRTEAEHLEINGAHVRAAAGGMVLHDWSVPADCDVEDMEQVKAANPLSTITVETLTDKRASPTMTHGHWMRFVCNRSHRVDSTAIDEREWEQAGTDEAVPLGVAVSVGIDLGWKWDDTALTPLWQKSQLEWLYDKPTILTPPRDGTSMSVERVKAAFIKIHKRNPVELVVMDPNADGESIAQWIESEFGINVVAHGQSHQPMCLASSRFIEGLRSGRLKHPRDPEFTRHVLNAVEKILSDGRSRFERASSSRAASLQDSRVIDALDAAMMVNSVLVAETQIKPWSYDNYRIELL